MILAIWAVAQIAAFLFFGPVIAYDSATYISAGKSILEGAWPSGYVTWYSAYCLMIAVTLLIGAAPVYVIVLQLILSALATWSVYKITFRLSQNRTSAFIAATLFAIWPDIQQWNFIVYTDAPFACAVLITISAIMERRNMIMIICLILFTIFLRPVGIVFMIACVVYLIAGLQQKYLYSIGAAVLLMSIFAINYMMRDYVDGFIESYAKGEIIYPDISAGFQTSPDLYIPSKDHPPVFQPVMFALGNPFYFLRMSVYKGLLFIGHVKPYFSMTHNILIAIFLWPLYVLAFIGFRKVDESPTTNFILVFILLQVLMVSLTSENWDGRFLLPVLPWVFILSSVAIARWKYAQ